MHPCRPSKILYYLISAKYDLENIFSKFCFSGPPMNIIRRIAISFSDNFVKSIWINKGLYFSIFGQSQTYKTCLPGLIIYVSCFDLFCIFCWNQISHTISHRVYSWNGITEVSTLDKLLCSFIHTIDKHIFVFFNYCFC